MKKGTHVPEVKPIRRPGQPGEDDRKRPLTGDELAKALGKGPGLVRYTPKAST